MKFKKLDLLTLLISLFLLSSCKDSSSIGLDVDPNTVIQGTLLDTVTVKSQTVADVPVTTLGLSTYPIGEMHDDIFGETNASLAMTVATPSVYPAFGTTTVIDSAVLILPYTASSFYGDSTSTYNLSVSQLSSNLALNSGFLSNKEYPASATVIGTFSGRLKPTTRPKVTDIVPGAADTAITVVPQIRVRLDNSFIKNQITALDSVSLSTTARFAAQFKGLKVNASVSSGKGGMAFLNFSSGVDSTAACIAIYYKKQNATTATTIDTLVSRFQIVSATATPVAATVKHTYTGTDIATQLANPATAYQTTYLQTMSGVRNKITFPYLKDLVAKIGTKIIINKAELVIDTSDPADSIPFKIPRRLTLYQTDIAGQRVQVQDNNPYSSTNLTGDIRTYASGILFNGGYDYTKKSYSLILTNYVQDIVDGKTVDLGTYLATIGLTDSNPLNLYPYATSAGRVVIGSFNNTNNRKMRLNIYYTKSKQ